jgi:protein unc-13
MLSKNSSQEMLTLIVSVKKARLQGSSEDFHSYITVKLQNVKSTTVAVRGTQPSWEQEFIFETNRLDQGLMLELWNKGVLWDKLLGVHYMPLTQIQYTAAPGNGKWLQIDQELETKNGETVGTKTPSGHSILVDVRFELPFDSQVSDNDELQARLRELNNFVETEHQHLQRVPFHSGISEDSDYTSDVSFPIQQQQQPNSSVHQWDSHLRPQKRSAEERHTEELEHHPHRQSSPHTDSRYVQQVITRFISMGEIVKEHNIAVSRQ